MINVKKIHNMKANHLKFQEICFSKNELSAQFEKNRNMINLEKLFKLLLSDHVSKICKTQHKNTSLPLSSHHL